MHAEIDVIWLLNFSVVILFCVVCSHLFFIYFFYLLLTFVEDDISAISPLFI